MPGFDLATSVKALRCDSFGRPALSWSCKPAAGFYYLKTWRRNCSQQFKACNSGKLPARLCDSCSCVSINPRIANDEKINQLELID